MSEHAILGLMLLIQTGLLVSGLRMMVIMSREVEKTVALAQVTLDAVSKLFQQK